MVLLLNMESERADPVTHSAWQDRKPLQQPRVWEGKSELKDRETVLLLEEGRRGENSFETDTLHPLEWQFL